MNSQYNKRIIINLVGPTGSGKTTQAKLLSEYLKIPHVSTGDLFRNEMSYSQLGELIRCYVSKNNDLVPDEITYGILMKRLIAEDCNSGFILEGFPITKSQSEFLVLAIFKQTDLYVPIELLISDKVAIKRLAKRLICTCCGNQQALSKSKSADLCLNCNNKSLVKREDDISNNIILAKRIIYKNNCTEISNELSKYTKLVIIEQTHFMTIEQIFNQIKLHLNFRLSI